MIFSSIFFLFLFLPIVIAVYYAVPQKLKNAWLLLSSLVFYAWGDPYGIGLLLALVLIDYAFGLWIDRVRGSSAARWVLGLCVVVNLAPLLFYKYTAFFLDSLSSLLTTFGFDAINGVHPVLPLGISFMTFHTLSYAIDVYRGEAKATRNPVDVALYIAFFPQLIAGPIIRYVHIAEQLQQRTHSSEKFASGIERFVCGMAKKVLLANSAASVADQIFAIPGTDLTAPVAWLGIFCYALQIYYDFSGYSDMAVGLGSMFGIRIMENFNYPYTASSVTDFWRRWHISLSVWFRDYVYIPLGGNRRGNARTYANLLIVFLLCGLWHGASWNFIAWGLFYGFFLVVERYSLGRVLERLPRVATVAYTMTVVLAGWVLFRADDLMHAGLYYRALCGLGTGTGLEYHTGMYLDRGLCLVMIAGFIGAMPWLPALRKKWNERAAESHEDNFGLARSSLLGVGRIAVLIALLLATVVVLSASTYNPFIYFRF